MKSLPELQALRDELGTGRPQATREKQAIHDAVAMLEVVEGLAQEHANLPGGHSHTYDQGVAQVAQDILAVLGG